MPTAWASNAFVRARPAPTSVDLSLLGRTRSSQTQESLRLRRHAYFAFERSGLYIRSAIELLTDLRGVLASCSGTAAHLPVQLAVQLALQLAVQPAVQNISTTGIRRYRAHEMSALPGRLKSCTR